MRPAGFCLFLLLLSLTPSSHAYNALEECRALSADINDIHNCLDNYLDLMDSNLANVGAYIEGELEGTALSNYQASQAAFLDFRNTNCLWYLELTPSRDESEQVAKNCLVRMSQDRLSELQSLISTATQKSDKSVRGYYVYGAERNTFQLCGSDKRYWVEGVNTLIGELQQTYLNLASADLQLIYVVLAGETDDEAQTVAGHDGVFNITNMTEMRLPQESDCRLPGTQVLPPVSKEPAALPVAKIEAEQPAVTITEQVPAEETEVYQELRAYFGDWQVDCTQENNKQDCVLLVPFAAQGRKASDVDGDIYANAPVTMKLRRRADKRTTIELRFPDMEIDSPSKIHWRVDKYTFGDILGSDIRVDEQATRQLLTERKFIRDDLLPLLIGGTELGINVKDNAVDESGKRFNATLLGLTRALTFADDFVSSGGNI